MRSRGAVTGAEVVFGHSGVAGELPQKLREDIVLLRRGNPARESCIVERCRTLGQGLFFTRSRIFAVRARHIRREYTKLIRAGSFAGLSRWMRRWSLQHVGLSLARSTK